ncbi:MAG: hypothetical protein E7514_02845 [Ruminococcaceae bacterium]|nr:hypothetical protein [Oscillospiraceae bacterium]
MGKNKVKGITALLLVSVLLFGLCSCKSKDEEEPTTLAETTAAYYEVTEANEVTVPATEQTVQPSKQTVTEAPVTEAAEEPVSEEAEITGTKTVTEGNKTIVYPAALEGSQRTYPVIAWANGTACPTNLYIKLIEAIANGGYIVIADSTTMSGDGTAQIDSLNFMLNKNADSSGIFYNKVDTSALGVCGQSQGGRSCINAAQKDSRIRCVVSIAGASSADESRGLNTPCLFLTGTSDNIVVSSQWCQPSYDAVTGRAAYASLIGGNHLAFMNNTAQIAEYTLDWFDAYLKNNADARAVFYNGGKLANDSAWQDFQNKN